MTMKINVKKNGRRRSQENFNENLRLLTCLVMTRYPLTFDWATMNYKITNKLVR
jgi:hypothetical protein